MEGQGTMTVRDALLMIADRLEGIRIPAGLPVREAAEMVMTLQGAANDLRMCHQALTEAKAKEDAKAAEAEEAETDERPADAE